MTPATLRWGVLNAYQTIAAFLTTGGFYCQSKVIRYPRSMSIMSMRENLADNVRTALARSGLQQKILAKKIGIHRVSLSQLLRKQYDPSLALVQKIADALNVEPAERLLQKNCFGADLAIDAA